MSNTAAAMLIGLIAGAHIATWGMYKDSLHEGFAWPKYLRSVVLGALVGLGLESVFEIDLSGAAGWVVFFGMVYSTERVTWELWKGCVREEDQSKYHIPMQFGVGGKPVESRAVRLSVLVGVVIVLAVFVWGVNELQRVYSNLSPWLVVITIGSLGGWLTAFGGAWKDAPVEGFETLKFFRSPLISLFWAMIMACFTTSWLFIAVAGAGYSVATIESYKKFFSPGDPPGKFAGKPVLHPEMRRFRRLFLPVYVVIWSMILGTFILAFSQPSAGLITLASE